MNTAQFFSGLFMVLQAAAIGCACAAAWAESWVGK